MPLFTFKNLETGEVVELLLSQQEREDYLRDNPNMVHMLQPIRTADPTRLMGKKPDESFRDVLRTIKKKHTTYTTDTTINTF